MRMRRKRNLTERLESFEDMLLVKGRPMLNLKAAAESFRALIDPKACFQNANPVELEVGCGNGGFISELARRRPDTNFFAVEICSNVILNALERCAGLKNVRFLNIPAEILPCYIGEGSVQGIYLNFSTPLPERSRERQRLTSPRFLEIYHKLLKDNGFIVQKTDSEPFFAYSLRQYTSCGFALERVIRDLHASEYKEENIVTEYERNFAEKGLPIYCAVARKTEV